MTSKHRIPAFALLFAALTLGACDNDPAGADSQELRMQRAAGSYHMKRGFGALKFTTTTDGKTTDQLELGASLVINLSPDGTTSGLLHVPDADEDGGDLDADMAGKWTMRGDTVFFEQNADTFVRDMPFVAHGNRLEGDKTFGDFRIQVVLAKQ